jgi:hypothetical protein
MKAYFQVKKKKGESFFLFSSRHPFFLLLVYLYPKRNIGVLSKVYNLYLSSTIILSYKEGKIVLHKIFKL